MAIKSHYVWEFYSWDSEPFNAQLLSSVSTPRPCPTIRHYYYRRSIICSIRSIALTPQHQLSITHYHGGLYRNVRKLNPISSQNKEFTVNALPSPDSITLPRHLPGLTRFFTLIKKISSRHELMAFVTLIYWKKYSAWPRGQCQGQGPSRRLAAPVFRSRLPDCTLLACACAREERERERTRVWVPGTVVIVVNLTTVKAVTACPYRPVYAAESRAQAASLARKISLSLSLVEIASRRDFRALPIIIRWIYRLFCENRGERKECMCVCVFGEISLVN